MKASPFTEHGLSLVSNKIIVKMNHFKTPGEIKTSLIISVYAQETKISLSIIPEYKIGIRST